tara:strand:- start:1174 stop:2799 length:1626 start_codon:yes stop_codon:yes gene_type:complete
VSTLLEAVSISLLLPIIVSLSENNFYDLYPKFGFFLNYFKNILSAQIIYTATILFICTIIFKNFLLIFTNYKENDFLLKVQEKTSQRLFKKFLLSNFNFHVQNKSSDLITKIRNETRYFSEGVFAGINIISDLLLIICISTVLIIVSFKITIVSIIFAFFFSYIFLLFFRKYINKFSKNRSNLDFKKNNIVQESILGIREIILSNISSQVINNYNSASNSFAKSLVKYQTVQSLPKIYFEFIILVTLASALLYFTMDSVNISTKIIIPTIGLYAASAFKILPALNRLVNHIQRFKFAIPVIHEVYEDLTKNIQEIEQPESIKIKNIEIKSVSFSYKKPNIEIFKNANYHIKKGAKILIHGESGIGKSTLLDLLAGIQKPDEGQVVVNDKIILGDKFNLTKSLGYVSQKIFLFNDSLKYNISLEEADIDKKKLNNAIKNACLENLISKYKEGLELKLGENGSILSGGQKQRVMIARALYNSSDFLIMDEPTSSLDNKTAELLIKNLVNKKDLTLIVVSHNIYFKKFFQKIIEIDKKQIIEKV